MLELCFVVPAHGHVHTQPHRSEDLPLDGEGTGINHHYDEGLEAVDLIKG